MFYFDSSALVKYYISEAGSDWVRKLIDGQAVDVAISQLTLVEIAAAVEKRRRMSTIDEHLRIRTLARFGMDCQARYIVVRVSDAIVELSVALTARHPLRAYDAVQLASALQIHEILNANNLAAVTFVSSDKALCQAAQAEGLAMVNPAKQMDR